MGRWRARHGESERRVLMDGLPRQQSEMLEDHGDARRGPDDPFAEHPQLAGAEIDETGDATQESRLTAPARPDNAEDLLTANIKRDLAERHHGAVEEQLARRVRADRNLGIRFRNRHAADVLPCGVGPAPAKYIAAARPRLPAPLYLGPRASPPLFPSVVWAARPRSPVELTSWDSSNRTAGPRVRAHRPAELLSRPA